MTKALPPCYQHQEDTANFWAHQSKIIANFSDAGTGKTRATLEGYIRRPNRKRMLVVGALSILEPAWYQDILKWTPNLRASIAYAGKREEAFNADTDIVIINHDGVNWIKKELEKNPNFLDDFDTLVVDESTAFKNRTAGRTKAIFKIAPHFEYKAILTGTPNPNGLDDLWSQIYILDQGDRLTPNFFHYRNSVQTPKQVGPDPRMVKWVDKPHARDTVAAALADITIRYNLEECIDMPECITKDIVVKLPKKVMDTYHDLQLEMQTLLDSGVVISAVHAGALLQKLQQITTGCVYANGNMEPIYDERYELVLDLVQEVNQSLVAFNYKHEVEGLKRVAEKRKIRYAVINGDTPVNQRNKIVAQYQANELDVIFAHPQSAGHGLTLTEGTRTIWASPTYNAEHYVQLNRRLYRAGQTKRTEIIRIIAQDTVQERIYNKLDGKTQSLDDTLSLLRELAQK